MPTNTTNLNLKKPIVGADEDLWGGYINDNLDDLDAYLSGTTAIPALDVTGAVTVGGTVTADGLTVGATVPIVRLDSPVTAWAGGEDLGGVDWYTEDTSGSGPAVMARIYSESSGANTLPIPNMIFQTSLADVALKDRMQIAGNGDISFYEDTGTTPKFFWDASAERLGIGTSSPNSDLHVENAAGSCGLRVISSPTGTSYINLGDTGDNNDGSIEYSNNSRYMLFKTADTERMRLDQSGNLLVGTTTIGNDDTGCQIEGAGILKATRNANVAGYFRRNSTDGDIVQFGKDGTTVGSIGNNGSRPYICSTGHGLYFGSTATLPTNGSGAAVDNTYDLGISSVRWDDIYATNGTIQTSDRNEKQDIEALSDAEQRVAVACKGLLRKFRWKDAVAEKGDDARIHFGIIAQDLQDAFAAEGLDAGRYAMFISTTWWETQTEVPAVEAVDEVLDEDGNVIQEAIEAKEAYIRTDTYDTAEEAPAGATERTRLGVRYPELLAFIIAAM